MFNLHISPSTKTLECQGCMISMALGIVSWPQPLSKLLGKWTFSTGIFPSNSPHVQHSEQTAKSQKCTHFNYAHFFVQRPTSWQAVLFLMFLAF